jgi:hypothetical protein
MSSLLSSTSIELMVEKKVANSSDDRQNSGSYLKEAHETDPAVTRKCKIKE